MNLEGRKFQTCCLSLAFFEPNTPSHGGELFSPGRGMLWDMCFDNRELLTYVV
jgi:hypothetical protein